MRTTNLSNPIDKIKYGITHIIKHDPKRAAAIGNYILTGMRLGNKEYYNSFIPNYIDYYTGFTPTYDIDYLPKNDLIDAFLYKKTISPKFGVKNIGSKDYGVHSGYIKKYYSDKDIQIYETSPDKTMKSISTENIPKAPVIKEVKGDSEGNLFITDREWKPDVAGHLLEYSYDLTGHNMVRGQDIWKFNPDDYIKNWLWGSPSKLNKLGLKIVDNLGTPVITRTKWISIPTSEQELLEQRTELGLPALKLPVLNPMSMSFD